MQLESTLSRYFREVYRLKSIRHASSSLNVAPSAVSRQISRLEQMVGVPLFERLPRGVAPTEAADTLARFSRNFLLDVERLRGEIDSLRGLQRGHIRIMANEGLVDYLLTRTVVSFHKRFPGITYELEVAGTSAITRSLHDGTGDIGLVFNAEADELLSFAAHIHDPLCAVVAPGHPLARAPSLDLSEVVGHTLAVPEKTFGIRRLIDSAVSARRLHLSPTLETNSIAALKGFARYGGGVTFLPTLPTLQELESCALVSIPIVEDSFQRASHDVCVMAGRRLPLAVSAFVDMLKVEADRASASDRPH
ncbi:LysR family transcriptional regulator [Bradyrhizobium cosmicum]|uniref:Transcriptional regulatory protein LysR family n=1 Tax=Bradyrhizobium cosmicum TaxID=1404864 RepID=A0AAI8MHL1_9BRAD|nr:LysR family transcriptional regulator [Bradyrhizobium cosmicum]BAL78736.1 transcriptional regulatory protein LysR family [Bradyrhizobium cosmicum]